jgi:general L-amino acid transport system permease protein
MTENKRFSQIPSFLLDVRIIAILLQIVFVVLVVLAVNAIGGSIIRELASRGITPTFSFLNDRAGFELADAGSYTPDDTYLDAFMVGVINTLRVVSVGLVLTTVLGVLWGVFLLSGNWLVRNITRVIVEILRNTPLLVQLFVWYYVVVLALPAIKDGIAIPPEGIAVIPLRWALYTVALIVGLVTINRLPRRGRSHLYFGLGMVALVVLGETLNLLPAPLLRFETAPLVLMSNKGVAIPMPLGTVRFTPWLAILLVGIFLAALSWVYFKRKTEATGKRYPRAVYAFLIVVAAAVIGWFVVSAPPAPDTVPVEQNGQIVQMPRAQALEEDLIDEPTALLYERTPISFYLPERRGLRYAGGLTMLPEYTALLLGLVVYTAAFIAEIVRAGILAVPYGQVEAARSLGFGYLDSLRLIILPQALRVIIPPLGNQYLNLAKNSSLAIAISFTDLFQVTGTIINQTGQSVSGILMVMGVYLAMSLVISLVMNLVNRRFQLVTR